MRILVICAHMIFEYVGGVFRYYSCEGDEHGFDAHKIPVLKVQHKVKDEPEDVFEKIMGTGTCDDC